MATLYPPSDGLSECRARCSSHQHRTLSSQRPLDQAAQRVPQSLAIASAKTDLSDDSEFDRVNVACAERGFDGGDKREQPVNVSTIAKSQKAAATPLSQPSRKHKMQPSTCIENRAPPSPGGLATSLRDLCVFAARRSARHDEETVPP